MNINDLINKGRGGYSAFNFFGLAIYIVFFREQKWSNAINCNIIPRRIKATGGHKMQGVTDRMTYCKANNNKT